MSAYADVFQRVEKKYLVNPAQNQAVHRALAPTHMTDAWGATTVTSVYWDTSDRSVIARSLEKPLYKEKLRARAYGTKAGRALVAAFARYPYGENSTRSEEALPVFFELKKKLDGVVYKRRVGLSLGALAAFVRGVPFDQAIANFPCADPALQQQARSAKSQQIARELQAALERWGGGVLRPSMAIACEREALVPRPIDPDAALAASLPCSLHDLRATFDRQVRSRDLARDDQEWQLVLGSTTAVMELKCAGALDRGLSGALAAHRIYPQSFSKYGAAVKKLGRPAAGKGARCA